MEQTSGWFNDSIDLIPFEKMFVLASSFEDQNSEHMDSEYRKMAFMLDAACPDKFIAIWTGNYVFTSNENNPDQDDFTKEGIYDNYNNRIIFMLKTVWDEYKHKVALHEQTIYKGLGKNLPEHKSKFLTSKA